MCVYVHMYKYGICPYALKLEILYVCICSYVKVQCMSLHIKIGNFVCAYVPMYKYGICPYVGCGYTCHRWSQRRTLGILFCHTLGLVPLSQSLSVKLEVGWWPASLSNPPVSTTQCQDDRCVCMPRLTFNTGTGIRTHDLMLTHQVLLFTGLSF